MNLLIFLSLILSTTLNLAFAKTETLILKNRNYLFVKPSRVNGPRPLVILLHGCKQTADLIVRGTRFDKEAEKRGFYLLVPEQNYYSNTDRCWNWFFSNQQIRHPQNEMGEIISALNLITSTHSVDKNKIFVAGLSAGGAMAENLAVCYPDYFKGFAVHSGLAYKVAESIIEAQDVLTRQDQKSPEDLGFLAFKCLKERNNKRLLKQAMVIHGLKDERVLPLHAELISQTHEVLVDYMDDGRRNSSDTSRTNEETLRYPNGYTLNRHKINYLNFNEELIFIKELAHEWSGGAPVSRNFNPESPSSTQLIINFFNL
jgi:poly(hydroxyalkanoate) depolymerase family esterase